MTIDEIIEEGERLEREAKAAWRNSCIADAKEATRRLSEWRNVWCPRLIAVAKAAVEMVNAENGFHAFYGFTGAVTKRVMERRFAAFAALDAAVRGDAATEEGRNG